jgi:hypothetical protein
MAVSVALRRIWLQQDAGDGARRDRIAKPFPSRRFRFLRCIRLSRTAAAQRPRQATEGERIVSSKLPMLLSQRVVQVCLFLVAAIAVLGGTYRMRSGQPDTSPSLDNVHRFMAGVSLSTGIVSFWVAATITRQATLLYLLRTRPPNAVTAHRS